MAALITEGSPPHPYIEAESGESASLPQEMPAGAQDVDLLEIAHGRSGDKGDTSNVAVFARNPEQFAHLKEVLNVSRVRAHLGHLIKGGISRYEAPGLHALNFVMNRALDGGGPSSLRTDPMGKGMAQMLLEMKVPPPGAASRNA